MAMPHSLRFTGQQTRLAVRRGKRVLQRAHVAHPLATKIVPTAIGYAFGDVLTQVMAARAAPGGAAAFDARKTLGMAAAGGAAGAPLSFALYRWMDAAWPGASLLLAAGKFTLDQALGCAVWQAAYCLLPGANTDAYRTGLAAGLARTASAAEGGARAAVGHAAAAAAVVLPAAAAA